MDDISKTEASKDASPASVEASGSRGVFAALFAHWKVWLPGAGALSLLAHFWRIGYAPSLSFGDVGTVLGAMLLASVVGLLAVFALFLLPLFIISQWVEGGLLRGPPVPVAESERLSDRARNAQDRRTLRGKRSKALDHPALRLDLSSGSVVSFCTAGLASIAVYTLVVIVAYYIDPARISEAFLLIFSLSCGMDLLLFLSINRTVLRKHLRYLRQPRQQWLILFLVYMGSWPMVILPFLKAGAEYLDREWLLVLGILCVMPLFHWAWFVTWRVKKTTVWAFRVVPLLFVLTASGLPIVFLDSTMNAFGLGMLRNIDLVLTPRGCEIAHAAWPERACAPDHRGSAEAYRLENIEVLTRIGGHYFIAAPGALDDKRLPRFPIPADEVLSWRRRPPAESADAKSK